MTKQILIAVSGPLDHAAKSAAEQGERPRIDYFEMERMLDADLLDTDEAVRTGGIIGWVLAKLFGTSVALAWACFQRRQRYKAILTDGEHVGLPLALLLKLAGMGQVQRIRHLMITHHLAAPKKMYLLDWLGLHKHIDRFLVYATWQKRFIEQRWPIPPEHVILLSFMVDTHFFSAQEREPLADEQQICAVGQERRDYNTLMQAVDGLAVQTIVVDSSHWSKHKLATDRQHVPTNVAFQRYDYLGLRQLYAESRFTVVPLEPVFFQAGITSILEAMAMARAVICTRAPGQIDTVVEGETGLYVPPNDPAALRAAITYLLEHPEEAERMGKAGRRRVEQSMTIERYVQHIGAVIHACLCDYDMQHVELKIADSR